MAALSITASSLAPGSNAQFIDGVAGVAITAGSAVYRWPSDGKYYLADANAADIDAGTTGAPAKVVGIAVNSAPGVGQPVKIQVAGDITIGAALTVGDVYAVHSTAGGIGLTSDIASGWFTGLIGFAISTTVMRLAIGYHNGTAKT